VLVIVTAWLKVPSLREIGTVNRIPASLARKIELPVESASPYHIKAICKKVEPNTGRQRLQAFTEIDFARDIERLFAEKGSFVTRVHAELLLVDEFSRNNYKFVDNDKYIGCSKRRMLLLPKIDCSPSERLCKAGQSQQNFPWLPRP
jgi:hypothetical protein